MIVTPWNIEQIDDTYAKEVQSNLLKIILYTTFTLSLLSAFLASICQVSPRCTISKAIS